ncbi:V-type ATP synthase subunit F [Streptomyces collinus]|uniref:V-type ATP synthase subunit F n=1 Tax=Streptomyces collinus TaxID=42684 RepID=UPI0029427EA3|nr:V-type ATP synthase subunit F [Streptomyces collinus]
MGTVAAIGARTSVYGLALAGVDVLVAQDPDAVRRAWRTLPSAVGLVILTAEAADALGSAAMAPAEGRPLTVVMPS